MATRTVKLGLVQMAARDGRERNLGHALTRVREAHARGASIICLGELFTSPYFCQVEDEGHFRRAEPIPGPTTQAVSEVAAELGVVVIAPLFERRSAGLYHNTAAVVGPRGELLGLYRKMHIPHDPQFYEKYYFAPGDLGFVAVETPYGRIGPLICYDQWFPEAARLAVLGGAEILFYPTAIGWLPAEKAEFGASQLAAWQNIHRSHAVANGVFVAAVNRVGWEGDAERGIEFWGHSLVCDPFGRVLCEAGPDEDVLVVDCELDAVERARLSWPFLRDRRVDAYHGLTARFSEP
jgi:N-carbamoylputrescine amidase